LGRKEKCMIDATTRAFYFSLFFIKARIIDERNESKVNEDDNTPRSNTSIINFKTKKLPPLPFHALKRLLNFPT